MNYFDSRFWKLDSVMTLQIILWVACLIHEVIILLHGFSGQLTRYSESSLVHLMPILTFSARHGDFDSTDFILLFQVHSPPSVFALMGVYWGTSIQIRILHTIYCVGRHVAAWPPTRLPSAFLDGHVDAGSCKKEEIKDFTDISLNPLHGDIFCGKHIPVGVI